MTKNKAYKDCKSCKSDTKFTECKPKHSKPQNILLECGKGSGSRTFTSSDNSPFQLAHVTVDTTFLNKPEVVIKFSSLVRVDIPDVGLIRLKYELFRTSDGKEPLSVGTWEFEKVIQTLLINSIEESFNFTFCECLTRNDCYDYFITVTPVEVLGTTSATATISNGRMAALAQDLYDSSVNNLKKDVTECKCLEVDKILLACGQGTVAGQTLFFNPTEAQLPISLAQVTIDTACLNKPKVLIEFSSMIITSITPFPNIVLQFELFRVCGDSEPISCGIWRFEQVIDAIDITSQEQRSFSFIFCEYLNISECCTYFVKVTPVQLQLNEGALSAWNICNTHISAYAQSSRDDKRKTLEDKGEWALGYTEHPKPKKILVECGSSTGSRTFAQSNEFPFQLASVTIDTTELCEPIVNIEFSSILNFMANPQFGASIGQVKYELFRTCDGSAPLSLGVWAVERFPLFVDETTETFDFTYCDCVTCPGCCDYFVTATPIESLAGDIIGDAILTVSNGRIAASAQEG